MNPCFLTPRGTKTYESIDEVRAARTDGAEFRIYMYGNIITRAETNRLLRAKFTHVRIVWQNKEFRVMHVDIELKEIH
jgi:hypothetical protein